MLSSRVAPAVLASLLALAGCDGPSEPPVDGGAPAVACESDDGCDDGVFCNGLERCAPGADGGGVCQAPSRGPCDVGQTCDEALDTCRTDCAVTEDADGDGIEAAECGGRDCDDSDGSRYPGNAEVCDVDRHDEDCDPSTFGVRDMDDDGEADAACCNAAATGALVCGSDCDDTSSNVRPGQTEACNGRDDDCDASVDELVLEAFYPDRDGDGFGDPEGSPTMACAPPGGTAANVGDCDDAEAASNPAAPEVCDGIDNDCSGEVDEGLAATLYPDADRDGFGDASVAGERRCPAEGWVTSATDCDDASPAARPGLAEICDGLDNDCDGSVDESLRAMLYPDLDGDGDGDATAAGALSCPGPGLSPTHTDCDDASRVTYGGAPELCDLRDNDCDGPADEGTVMVPWYPDADGDGFGNPRLPAMLSCSAIAGRSQLTECDDTRADVHPGAPQLCDRIDNTCSTDDGSGRAVARASEDSDSDGHASITADCAGGPLPRDDCDDTRANAYPGAPELCDRLDQDCSSMGGVATDEDADGDGHAPIGAGCTGGTLPRDDCADTRAIAYPGAAERCNGLDDDCSSGGGAVSAEDADGDRYAPPSAMCSGGTFPRTDCDDTRAGVSPGAAEICNGIDDDCSGTTDIGCPEDVTVGARGADILAYSGFCASYSNTSLTCPAGTAATRLAIEYVRVDCCSFELQAVQVSCSDLAIVAAGGAGSPITYTVSVGAPATAGTLGDTSPSLNYDNTCPAGSVITGTLRGGAQIQCSPLTVPAGTPGAYTVTLGAATTVGLAGSSAPSGTATCPAGQAMVYARAQRCGTVPATVASWWIACAPLSIDPL